MDGAGRVITWNSGGVSEFKPSEAVGASGSVVSVSLPEAELEDLNVSQKAIFRVVSFFQKLGILSACKITVNGSPITDLESIKRESGEAFDCQFWDVADAKS